MLRNTMVGVAAPLALAGFSIALAPTAARAQQCKDVEYTNESGDKMKTTDCEEIALESAKLVPVLVCPAPVKPKEDEFHGLSLLSATKHRDLGGKLVTLSKGYIINVNFGSEDQTWVIQNARVKDLGKGKVQVEGDLVEAVLSEKGKAPKADPEADKTVTLVVKVRRDGDTQEAANVLLNGKRRFGCGNGSYDGSLGGP